MPKSKGVEYQVGKGRPPPATRFAKGQSGNPAGRPRGSVSLVSDLEAELRAEVTVSENGRTQKLTKQRLLVKSVLTRAVKGDRHATAQMIDLIAKTMGVAAKDAPQAQSLSAEDQEVLDAFRAEIARSLGKSDDHR